MAGNFFGDDSVRLIDGPEALRGLIADVCVVGSGPVGLCLALDLAECGLLVVVLESGRRRPCAEAQALSDAIIKTPQHHAPMALAVCRALGGTSLLWGGRCVPLDAIDFTPRAYVPDSGWPITYGDLAAFHARASSLLGAGGDGSVRPGSDYGVVAQGTVLRHGLEWWSKVPNIVKQLASRLKACARLTVVLDTTVVDLQIDPACDSVHGVVIATASERTVFRAAKCFVLALGGIETTRLLLNVQIRFPRLFGGPEGALGRYYMGHLSGSIADLRFRDPRLVRVFHYQRRIGPFVRRLLMLDPADQRENRLPNTSFYPANPRIADARHRSGILSAIYLALSAPAIGSRLVAEVIRQGQTSGPRRYGAHLRNLLLDLPGFIVGATEILRQVLFDGRSKPLLFLPSKAGRHPLHFHAEQQPRRESRIRLAPDRDRLGLRRAAIDLRFSNEDGAGIVRAHVALERALQKTGVADLIYRHPPDLSPSARPARRGRSRGRQRWLPSDRIDAHGGQSPHGRRRRGLPRVRVRQSFHCRLFGFSNLGSGQPDLSRRGAGAPPLLAFATAA